MNPIIYGIIISVIILISGIFNDELNASATSFELVSISIEGQAGNFPSFYPDLSDDGRLHLFTVSDSVLEIISSSSFFRFSFHFLFISASF